MNGFEKLSRFEKSKGLLNKKIFKRENIGRALELFGEMAPVGLSTAALLSGGEPSGEFNVDSHGKRTARTANHTVRNALALLGGSASILAGIYGRRMQFGK